MPVFGETIYEDSLYGFSNCGLSYEEPTYCLYAM